jgi:hypothetical protein
MEGQFGWDVYAEGIGVGDRGDGMKKEARFCDECGEMITFTRRYSVNDTVHGAKVVLVPYRAISPGQGGEYVPERGNKDEGELDLCDRDALAILKAAGDGIRAEQRKIPVSGIAGEKSTL